MTDKKISALTAAATPLAGTELVPVVQSGVTVQVAVSDLTAARAVSALSLTLTSTDASATASPLLELYRNSASPAASDTLGEIEFNGEDSAGNKQAYGLIYASILSPTSTAEQGQLHFETATAGALTEKMIIGTTNLVINDIGAIYNVRIEGDSEANLFFTDATNDRIGVGTASPDALLTVNTIASFGAGAVATPSIAAKGDLNTGVWFPAADTIAASTGGSERMRIGSSGDVGIATALPSSKLHINGSLFQEAEWAMVGNYNANGGYPPLSNVAVSFAWNFEGGNRESTLMNNDTSGGGFRFLQRTGASTNNLVANASSSGAWNQGNNSAAWTIISDARIKQNIRPISNALDKLAALNPCHFEYVDKVGKIKTGFIAQEFEQVFPGHIAEEEFVPQQYRDLIPEGQKLKGIDPDLMPYLVAAIQEQQQIIMALEARIQTLEK